MHGIGTDITSAGLVDGHRNCINIEETIEYLQGPQPVAVSYTHLDVYKRQVLAVGKPEPHG